MTAPANGRSGEAPRWSDVRALFEAALEVEPSARAEFVRGRAGTDLELAREVMQLLAQDAADGFLEPPLARQGSLVGRRLGPFCILREIASGGMGVVFEAEQDVPRRRVALKVLHSTLLGSEALRRFREESEIAARLRHPGIVQVLATGAARAEGDPHDVPFIALELVEGARTLPAHADSEQLAWPERLALLLQVCDAVQHGHQRGVIHRDLKPQNLLVDADGRCKVVDFGIARLVERSHEDARTLPGMILGTPAYMSPEQLAGDPDAIDVRTDVYALGIILFELCTARLPFDVRGRALDEVIRMVRDPARVPRPTEIAPELPRELDWIFAKAVQSEPAQRYATVAELAADLRRVLAHEPVLAGPPSTVYRLRKLARRHRLALSATAVVLASIVAGLVFSLASRSRAIEERDRARQEQRVAESVLDMVRGMIGAADPSNIGRDVRVRDVLRDAGREIAATQDLDPLVRAALEFTIGSTYAGLGMVDAARPHLERALAGFEAEVGPHDRRTIEAGAGLASVLRMLGELDAARARAMTAVERARVLPAADDLRVGTTTQLALVERSLGDYDAALARLHEQRAALVRAGASRGRSEVAIEATIGSIHLFRADPLAARPHLDRAVAIAESLYGPVHPQTLEVRHGRVTVLGLLGETSAAETELRAILTHCEQKLGEEHRWTLATKATLGSMLRRQSRHDEALALLEPLLAHYRALLGPDHETTLAAQNTVGLILLDLHRLEEAEALFRDALERSRRTFDATDLRLMAPIQHLAAVLRRQDRTEEAADLLREAYRRTEELTGPTSPLTLQARFNLGVLERSRGELETAAAHVAAALAGRRATFGDDHPDTLKAMHELMRIRLRAGDLDAAEELGREVVARWRARDVEEGDDDWISAAQLFALVLERQRKLDEARTLHEEVVAAAESAPVERATRTVNVRRNAAVFHARNGAPERARELVERNLEALDRDPTIGGDLHERLREQSAQVLRQLDARDG